MYSNDDDDFDYAADQDFDESLHYTTGSVATIFLSLPAMFFGACMFLKENPWPDNHQAFLFGRACVIMLDWLLWSSGLEPESSEPWHKTRAGLDYEAWLSAMHDGEFASKYIKLYNRLKEEFVLKEDLKSLLKERFSLID